MLTGLPNPVLFSENYQPSSIISGLFNGVNIGCGFVFCANICLRTDGLTFCKRILITHRLNTLVARNNFHIPYFLLCGHVLTNKLMPSWAVAWQSSEIPDTFCFYLMLLSHDTLMISRSVSVLVKMYLNTVYCKPILLSLELGRIRQLTLAWELFQRGSSLGCEKDHV